MRIRKAATVLGTAALVSLGTAAPASANDGTSDPAAWEVVGGCSATAHEQTVGWGYWGFMVPCVWGGGQISEYVD